MREDGMGREDSLFKRGLWGTESKALERFKKTKNKQKNYHLVQNKLE